MLTSVPRPRREPNLGALDIDGFINRNEPVWRRLEERTRRARRGPRRLAAGEVDELVADYQRVSAHLSHARTAYADTGLTARLTRLVAEANGVIYGKRARTLSAVARFFRIDFPAAVWHARRFVLVSLACLFLPAIAIGAWVGTSDAALEASGPEEAREAYLARDFEDYYSSDPAAEFATHVTINNITVAIYAFAAGIALCLGAVFIMVNNGAQLGVVAGWFVSAGALPKFLGLVVPHGLLELTAVAVAGGAGIAMGWSIIAPGDRTRTAALAEAGRRSIVIIIGLILAFVTAGTIEGFITGYTSTGIRVTVGVLVETVFVLYVVAFGRRAAAEGHTGLLGERTPTWGEVPVPASRSAAAADVQGVDVLVGAVVADRGLGGPEA
jgi:uncharacterized membrane protein SpoIIM required for sporulation